jgi:hypothetical protein
MKGMKDALDDLGIYCAQDIADVPNDILENFVKVAQRPKFKHLL